MNIRTQQFGSTISLISLCLNLLTPFFMVSTVQAASFEPATMAHAQPLIRLVEQNAPLTAHGATVLPRWFAPPAPLEHDLAAEAGLNLSVPAAVRAVTRQPIAVERVNRAAPQTEWLAAPTVPQPAMPAAEAPARPSSDWFAAPTVAQPQPNQPPLIAEFHQAVRPAEAAAPVLPAWFAEASSETETVARPMARVDTLDANATGDILPDWFETTTLDTAAPPDILPDWFETTTPDPASTMAELLPTWFNTDSPANSPAALPPLRPLLAIIPQLSLQVEAPATVDAGDEAVGGTRYTVTVRNNSASATAFNPQLGINIPDNFAFESTVSYQEGVNGVSYSIIGSDPMTWTSATDSLGPGEERVLIFIMSNDGNADSGQRLDVYFHYQNPENGTTYTVNAGQNVEIGRGNLVVSKAPTVQEASFGDEVSWEITLANTGLGDVYNTEVRDLLGEGFANADLSDVPSSVSRLEIGGRHRFHVTATVNSCTNLTNTAKAWWSIGNDENRNGKVFGTSSAPVSDTTDVIYNLTNPDISLTASADFDIPYCGPADPQTITVTLSNASGAGPATNMVLATNLNAAGFSVGGFPTDWSYNSGTGELSYNGTLVGGQSLNFEITVTPTVDFCSDGFSDNITMEAQYNNACNLDFEGPATSIDYSYANGGADAPGLTLSKAADSETTYTGDTVTFTVQFAAQNVQNMTGDIIITDTLPAGLTDLALLSGFPTVGTASIVGNEIRWAISRTSGDMTGEIQYQALVSDDPGGACDGNQTITNDVQGYAAKDCPTCAPLEPTASTDLIVQSVAIGEPGTGTNLSDVEICGNSFTISNTFVVTINDSWAGVIFTETLGTPDLQTGALTYQNGSLSVEVNGVVTTSNVTIDATSPQLVVDFSGLADLGSAQQRTIVIQYDLVADIKVLSDSVQNSFFNWSEFHVPGVGDAACTGDNTLYQGVNLNFQRADLQPTISPKSFVGCQTVPVTITVSDNNYVTAGLSATNVTVVFTATAAELATIDLISGMSYSGAFAGGPASGPTLSGNTITWNFDTFGTSSTDGTIGFDMQRGCGDSDLEVGVSFADQCLVSHSNTGAVTANPVKPNLRLFVTPDTYMVNERTARWRAYVTNIGDAIATTATITNLLGAGFRYVSHTNTTPGSSGLTFDTAGTPAAGDDVSWTLTNLDVGEQIQIDIFAAVESCGNVESTVELTSDCLGESCSPSQSKTLTFIQPDVDVRSANDQTADLPLCSEGFVKLVVKNAAADTHIYNMVITQEIEAMAYLSGTSAMTVTDRTGAVVGGLANIAFEPAFTETFSGGITRTVVMRWDLSLASEVSQTAILTDRGPEETITVLFEVETNCDSADSNSVQATAGGEEPCGNPFFRTESARTLKTVEPDITMIKQGRNVSNGETEFTNLVVGEPGDFIEWRISIYNDQNAAVAENLVLTDTLPENMNGGTLTVTPSTTATISSDTVVWAGTSGNEFNLAADEQKYFYIGGTIDSGDACAVDTENKAELTYGCDDGCRFTPPEQALATLRTGPQVEIQIPQETGINVCGDELTIVLNNTGAPAYTVTVTDTLPSGFVYSGTTSSVSPNPPNITPTDGDPVPVWEWTGTNPLPTGLTTITFNIRNAATSGTCANPAADHNDVALQYGKNSGCSDTNTFTNTTNTTEVQTLTLAITKTPRSQNAPVGSIVTWTISVSNPSGVAVNGVLVTDTAGSQYDNLTAVSNTSSATATTVSTNPDVIRWDVGTLAAYEEWTAVITAVVLEGGVNTNQATVTSQCSSGCRVGEAGDQVYVSPLNLFVKTPDVQTGTIGSVLTFTLLAQLSDVNGDYESILVTDTLPAGLGYVSASLDYVYDQDGNNGGPITVTNDPPDTTPAGTYGSGDVAWDLGTLEGVIQITGVITAVVQDVALNVDGSRRTNNFSLSYSQDGQDYLLTDTSAIDIQEPLIHLGKTYVTEDSCSATLLEDNFNVANQTVTG